MTFLPVVDRELRVASRRRATYWGRFSAALIGAALAAWILLVDTDSAREVGFALFGTLGAFVFIYAAVAGTLATSDCLSGEMREGTLGLLFLTDLNGYDVVLGKLAASSLNVIYGMVAVMPMLAIPFLLGGVTWAEMLRVVLVSANLLFFFLCIGLFASSLCHDDNRALGLSILIGLALVVTGWAVALFGSFQHHINNEKWMLPIFSSPLAGCILAFDAMYHSPLPANLNAQHTFWFNVSLTHFYGWLFLLMACWIVPRSWQERPVKKPWWRIAAFAARGRNRGALLDANPYLWRAMRPGGKVLLVWLPLAIVAVLWRWCFRNNSVDPYSGTFLLLLTGSCLKAGLATEASRTLAEDKRSGGLELLLCTPLHEGRIVRGQLLALWRQFARPVCVVFVAWLLFSFTIWRRDWALRENADFLRMCLTFILFLVADLIALSWVGMWMGMRHRKPNRAAIMAFAYIVFLPGILWVLLFSLGSIHHQVSFDTGWFLWIALGLAADFGFGLYAYANLRTDFREIVSEGASKKTFSFIRQR